MLKFFANSSCVALGVVFCAGVALAADEKATGAPARVDYAKDVRPILAARCYECHGPDEQNGGFRADTKALAFAPTESGETPIFPGHVDQSDVIRRIRSKDEDVMMPPTEERLTAAQIDILTRWIQQGAQWPEAPAVAGATTGLSLWSLIKPSKHAPPAVKKRDWARNPIDQFILAAQEKQALTPSPEADRRTLIRRLSFDLIGLPPTPQEVTAFLADESADAYGRLVERLLASPRYGERWARHWLDVVRFAETTGFEVNTPRENAWPYRDYVIKSLNDDKPYDQFVREQLAGDMLDQDAATGFIVGGSNDMVKSPDVVLTNQQRSDELHDMVATTGSAFLGLTVGCARCHNHKFDPIAQADYFAMTAVFAGVQHGERRLKTPDYEQRLQQAEKLRQLVTSIEGKLTQYEPLANPQATPVRANVSAKVNEEKFPPTLAKIVRFTIHETTDIEPCLDELEVYSTDGRNVALATIGTKPTSSGNMNAAIHRIEHINDGRVGNSYSWISNEVGGGWVQLEFPQPVMIDRIVWGRDREEKFKDRLATAYTIEAGVDPDAMKRVAGQTFSRPPVHPRMNAERFSPVSAKRLRFTVNATSGLEPCIDELEVYSPDGKNVALASGGTTATASSEYPNAAIHKIAHVNDGKVGNNFSWISSETSKGWVELEFPQAVIIDKVVWGRDREEKFKDRLATDYRIEVAQGNGQWKVVASSVDRGKYVPGKKYSPVYVSTETDPQTASLLRGLLAERARHEQKIAELTAEPMVYAGAFVQPEPTHRLHRGDPMQKREVVRPGGLSALPIKFQQPSQPKRGSDEQLRRLALANWIVDRENPLTARVIINRIWQHHFGTGLVETASDFGANGAKPSHPELLDWLAIEFVEKGWSIKAMHRLIVNSSTYRQASAARPDAMAIDASSRLLWRYPPRRLEAEPIRDSILAVSGKLDLRMGGPGFSVFEPNDNYVRVYNPKKQFGPVEWRRMIYMTKVRMQQDATFGAFDCPDGGQIAPKRSSSTTPLQALNLLNSDFVLQQAEFLGQRLKMEQGGDVAKQVQLGFNLAFSRDPTDQEVAAARDFVNGEGLTMFCRALLNANEFVYVY